MNLQTEISEVRSRLVAPARASSDDQFITDEEIIRWIYQAELRLVKLLPEDMLLNLQTEVNVDLVSGGPPPTTVDQDLNPVTLSDLSVTDFVRFLEAKLEVGQGIKTCRHISPEELRTIEQTGTRRPTRNYPYIAIFDNQFYVRPQPEAGWFTTNPDGKFYLRYVKRPTRRFKHYKGLTTGAGGTTTVVDSAAPGPDDWWNGTQLRISDEDAAIRGQEGTVTDFADASGTFTFAGGTFFAASGTNIEFEVGEVSDLPEECHELIVAYATYRGFMKDGESELAQQQLVEYTELLEASGARVLGRHKTEPMEEPR